MRLAYIGNKIRQVRRLTSAIFNIGAIKDIRTQWNNNFSKVKR